MRDKEIENYGVLEYETQMKRKGKKRREDALGILMKEEIEGGHVLPDLQKKATTVKS